MGESRIKIRQDIEKWFDAHADELLDDLRRLIAVKSVRGIAADGAPYGAGPREALSLVSGMLEERGFAVTNFEDIVITADIDAHPPHMGILSHVDVVGVGDGWDTDPFEMAIIKDKIFGRGATDNKGPTIAAMYAMYCAHELCPDMKKGFRLIIGSGEELGCIDVAQYLEKNTPPPNVFTPDAGYPVVNTEKGRFAPFFKAAWEKDTRLPRVVSIQGGKTMNVVPDNASAVVEGFSLDEAERFCSEYSAATGAKMTSRQDGVQIIIESKGVSSHAASPESGVNAQTALIRMLAAMPFAQSAGFEYICALDRLLPHGDNGGHALGVAMSDELSGGLTVNFGVLRFSEDEFSGNLDSRTPACADAVDLPGIARAAFEKERITMYNHTISECHHTPEDGDFVQALLRIYEEYTGDPDKSCLAIGGQTYVHGVPGGVAFGSVFPGEENCIHGANEFIGLEQLVLNAKIFAQSIIDICG
ncbi:MAG: Sapep family Mn(2+)-dependent dipeptidase [Oscillospiraceae bacterium]|nr:Sapep family Mn(2+)-dependent dipeptidase [Oscillospiraceae bacterium]